MHRRFSCLHVSCDGSIQGKTIGISLKALWSHVAPGRWRKQDAELLCNELAGLNLGASECMLWSRAMVWGGAQDKPHGRLILVWLAQPLVEGLIYRRFPWQSPQGFSTSANPPNSPSTWTDFRGIPKLSPHQTPPMVVQVQILAPHEKRVILEGVESK